MPLHFKQHFCRVRLTFAGPMPHALNEFFEVLRRHTFHIANSFIFVTVPVVEYYFSYRPSPHFAARFSANDASPSDASVVIRRAECISTRRV
jgi:hypothetical protein